MGDQRLQEGVGRAEVEHTEDCPGPRDVCTCGGYVPLSVAENLAAALGAYARHFPVARDALAAYRAAYPAKETP